ncbi:MAG: beta-ketoacyl synthase chain length factor [Kiritimatiellae bacterium]|nr:beta-ketoacyl synthase chain length factor [Kiritimatiellia bacterium]
MKRTLHLASFAIHAGPEAPDVSFVPPMSRRRLSPLQKIFFALADAAGAGDSDRIVFASRDGEDSLTRRLVADFREDASVSPHRFSTSVYNAAPGLWSVHAGNRESYTAIAAGEDTIECGLLETVFLEGPSLFVYAEETSGGYGAAARFAEGGGRRMEVELADGSGGPVGFGAWADFLAGRTGEIRGRHLILRDA